MRKIILSVAVSLDGFIEGPRGEYDWCPPPSADEMTAFLKSIDTIFMGRKSYESFEPSYFGTKEIVVFSDSLIEKEGLTIVRSDDFIKKVKQIKEKKGSHIWLYGGASLTSSFMNKCLVDEMWLGIVPIVLGSGKALFQNIEQRKNFKIEKARNSDRYLSVRLTKTEGLTEYGEHCV